MELDILYHTQLYSTRTYLGSLQLQFPSAKTIQLQIAEEDKSIPPWLLCIYYWWGVQRIIMMRTCIKGRTCLAISFKLDLVDTWHAERQLKPGSAHFIYIVQVDLPDSGRKMGCIIVTLIQPCPSFLHENCG